MLGAFALTEAAFGEAAEGPVSPQGQQATASVGAVTVTGVANVSPSGLGASAELGDISIISVNSVFVSGFEVTATVGDAVGSIPVVVSVTGLRAKAATITNEDQAPLFGGQTFAQGSFSSLRDTAEDLSFELGVTESVTGLEATASVGEVSVIGEANVAVSGLEATSSVEGVTVIGDANVSVVGVSADALKPNNGSAFTANGSAQLSTAQAKFGPSSLLLDGTDDFVTSDENIDLSSGDFTVDMWIRPTNVTGYKGLWQSGTSTLLELYLIGDQVQGVVGGSTILFLSSTRISANVWTMISVEREGNAHRLYINGALEASSSTGNRPDDGVFSIGKNGFGDFNGYIDELRLSSVARYEGTSFTEPTSNYAVDGDTTALLHFDGANGSTDIVNETEGVTIIEGQGVDAFVTSPRMVGRPGIVTAIPQVNVFVTGVSATGEVGQLNQTIWNPIDPSQTTTWTEIAA